MPPTEIGSITLVDQIVLLSLAKLISAQRIVEIELTWLFCCFICYEFKCAYIFNRFPKTNQKQINFNEKLVHTDGNYNDDFLRSKQNNKREIYLDYLTDNERKNISLVKADSTSINFQEKFGSADLVFIDGGHERSIVEKDTNSARSIVKNGVIIWHDYGSVIHNDVQNFLLDQKDRKIFHVLGSLCAFELIRNEEHLS